MHGRYSTVCAALVAVDRRCTGSSHTCWYVERWTTGMALASRGYSLHLLAMAYGAQARSHTWPWNSSAGCTLHTYTTSSVARNHVVSRRQHLVCRRTIDCVQSGL